MNIEALQRRLRNFAVARDWQSYHAPKNLAMALMVEAAELMEHFQWSTLPESRGLTRDPVKKEHIADEIADVLLYLLQLADHTGVDIEEAVEAKLLKNAIKHPSKHPQLEQEVETPAAGQRVHLLVDWENVQPDGPALKALVPTASHVWLLHGPSQKVDASTYRQCFGDQCVVMVPRSGSGKNALDFQLCFYTGYLSSSKKGDAFVVVSNDKGYDAMVEHATLLDFAVRRIEYRKVAPDALITAPLVNKTVVVSGMLGPSAAQIAWRLIVHRRKSGAWSQHWAPEDMHAVAMGLIREAVPDKTGLANRACGLAQVRIKYQGLARAACPELGRPVVAVGSETQVSQSLAAVAKAVDKKSVKAQVKAPVPRSKPAVLEQSDKPASVATYAKRVVGNLQKMRGNLPGTQAALLKTIQVHLGAHAQLPDLKQKVLDALVQRQDVQCLPDGKRVRFPSLESSSKKGDLASAKAKPMQEPKKQALKKVAAKSVAKWPSTKSLTHPKKVAATNCPKKPQAKSPSSSSKQSKA